MRIILLFLILLAVPTYGQFNVSLLAGVNPETNFRAKDQSDFLDLYWNPGITFGVASEVFISRWVAISPSIEFAYYAFDNYTFRGISIPEDRFKSATGEASKFWQLFTEVKLFSQTGKVFQIYFSSGVGYIMEKIGPINATFEDMNGYNFSRTIKFESTDFLVHTIGVGIRWSVLSYLALDFKGQYFTNYNDRMYTAVKCGFVYSVTE